MQTHIRDLYKAKRGLETEWAVHQRDNQRYTLDMVRIDNKIKEVVKKSAQKANKTNSWGSASQALRDEIGKLFEDSVNWKKTLQYFCGTKQKASKSRTFRRINRK